MTDYPSNIPRTQFELIRVDLESFRKHTCPRKVDLFDVFNAVLYEIRTSVQWGQLPHDFPKWQTGYTYFAMWSKPLPDSEHSLIDLLLKNYRPRAATNGTIGTNVVRNS